MLYKLLNASRTRFRSYIALLATGLFVAATLGSYGIYRKSQELLLDEAMGKNQVKAEAIAEGINHIFADVGKQLQQLSKLPDVQSCENVRNSVPFQVAFESTKNYITCLRRVNESGMVVAGYRGEACETIDEQPTGRIQEAIAECLEKREAWVTGPFVKEDGESLILISHPVFQRNVDGEEVYLGIVCAGIDPSVVENFVKYTSYDLNNAYFTIIDENGEIVMLTGNHAMNGLRLSDSEIRCSRCHTDLAEIQRLVSAGEGSSVIVVPDGSKKVVSCAKMNYTGLRWTVGVYYNYNYVMSSLSSVSFYTLLMALVVMMIILPGAYLLILLVQKREDAEERAKYLEKEKKLLEKIREADREINRHYRELSVLHELASEVNRTLDLQEVLKISLGKTIEVTPFDTGGIYILDGEENVFRLMDQVGIPEEAIDELDTIGMNYSLTGIVSEARELVFSDSIATDPRCRITSLKKLGYHSYTGIPLIHGTRLLGIMNLTVKQVIQIDERERKWLKGIGSIIGMAIGNCLLYQEVTDHAAEMGILYDVGNALTGTVEHSKLGEIVIEMLKSRLDYPACTLMILDKESGELYIEATSYYMEQKLRRKRFQVGKNGVTGSSAYLKETIYVPDVALDERYVKGRENTKSELSIPLLFGNDLLGVLDFEKDVKNGFSEGERRFLSLFANQVSGALYKVTMLEETMRMNEELNLISERKSEFVSLVSHELRTPLTAIKSSIDIILLKMKNSVDENVGYFLKIAKANVDRLSNMIDNILDISRIESGRMQFSYEVLNIKDLASKSIKNVAPLALQKNLRLEDRVGGDLPMVYADGGKIEQVLTNLIGNAIKFTPKGGAIIVEAQERNIEELENKIGDRMHNCHREFIQVTVQDTGPGIPEEVQEDIFRRFKRIEKRGGKGTGLGLAISKYLVESHGGGIWVESIEGEGSSFCFLIPLHGGGMNHDDHQRKVNCN